MTVPIPTEENEQRAFVAYCNLMDYPVFHVPNSTFTKSWQIKRRNTALGVSAGVPDLFVIAHGRLLAIEMKRQKGGTLSTAQRGWIDALNDVGVPAVICKSFDEAKAFVESWGITKQPIIKESEALF